MEGERGFLDILEGAQPPRVALERCSQNEILAKSISKSLQNELNISTDPAEINAILDGVTSADKQKFNQGDKK